MNKAYKLMYGDMDISIDHTKILDEIKTLNLTAEYLRSVYGQVMLQTVEGCTDKEYGIGRVTEVKHSENEFVVPIYDQLQYTNSIIQELGMTRTRLMYMMGPTCYTYHKDPTPRMHIPLITNDKCFMVLDDEVHRYPVGKAYFVDTTKMHTFVNGSTEVRLHIVGVLDSSEHLNT